MTVDRNIDTATVAGFGDEWTRFDQTAMTPEEKAELFDRYFGIFPFGPASASWEGFDLGCGSGRWASLVAPRVGTLHLIDPAADALAVAKRNLRGAGNCRFWNHAVDDIPLPDGSQDFGYSLGVLHHVPDTPSAITSCVAKLKPGAPLLLYLYYAFDNRPWWFRALWRTSDIVRRVVASMPHGLRYALSQVIAAAVYWPLAQLARAGGALGLRVDHWPLSFYADRSFYVMRTDALDRFGTRLEQRFTRADIERMMLGAGLERVTFSEQAPFWCAVGYRRA